MGGDHDGMDDGESEKRASPFVPQKLDDRFQNSQPPFGDLTPAEWAHQLVQATTKAVTEHLAATPMINSNATPKQLQVIVADEVKQRLENELAMARPTGKPSSKKKRKKKQKKREREKRKKQKKSTSSSSSDSSSSPDSSSPDKSEGEEGPQRKKRKGGQLLQLQEGLLQALNAEDALAANDRKWRERMHGEQDREEASQRRAKMKVLISRGKF